MTDVLVSKGEGMNRFRWKTGIGRLLAPCGTALLAMTLSAACLVPPPPPGTVFVASAPPTAEVEVAGVAPGPEYTWTPGYHRWDGVHYTWVGGSWERRPRADATWQPGVWRHQTEGWYWTDGRWK
jgi:hypothetical protein